MQLHFYNTEQYPTYEAAKDAGAIFKCDAPMDEDQFDNWGFDGGILCDAMQAVDAALRCVGKSGIIDAVLVDRGTVIKAWSEEEEQ
jgi:hypothetical protein